MRPNRRVHQTYLHSNGICHDLYGTIFDYRCEEKTDSPYIIWPIYTKLAINVNVIPISLKKGIIEQQTSLMSIITL